MNTRIKRIIRRVVIMGSLLFNVCFVFLSCWICFETNITDEILVKLGLQKEIEIPYDNKSEFLVAEAWANSLSKLNIDADVVFYGNSITFDSNFHQSFPNLIICNMGCKGDDLDDLINRSFLISSVHPKMIFIMGGINKLSQLSLDCFEKKYELMVDTIKKQNPQARVILQSLLPVNVNLKYGKQYSDCIDRIRNANSIIKEIAISSGVEYIDLYSVYNERNTLPLKYTEDGLHLKNEAYSRWANCISRYLD